MPVLTSQIAAQERGRLKGPTPANFTPKKVVGNANNPNVAAKKAAPMNKPMAAPKPMNKPMAPKPTLTAAPNPGLTTNKLKKGY